MSLDVWLFVAPLMSARVSALPLNVCSRSHMCLADGHDFAATAIRMLKNPAAILEVARRKGKPSEMVTEFLKRTREWTYHAGFGFVTLKDAQWSEARPAPQRFQ